MDSRKLCAILKQMALQIQVQKDELTALDNAIGDGDHGINMARGFEAVQAKLPELEGQQDLGAILNTVGMTLVSTVGGASGPLYGTAFMKAGAACKGLTELDGPTFQKAFEAAVGGIKMRGKSDEGEKTMLDALCPALRAYGEKIEAGLTLKTALEAAAIAAEQGLAHTGEIVAAKGRASYLGERSLGHVDPGAASSALMLKVLAENA